MWLFFKRRRLKKAGWGDEEAPPVLASPRQHMITSHLDSASGSTKTYSRVLRDAAKSGTTPIHEGLPSVLSIAEGPVDRNPAYGHAEGVVPTTHRIDHVMRAAEHISLTPHESGGYQLTGRPNDPWHWNQMHHFAPEGHREGATYISGMAAGDTINTAAHLFHPDTQAHAAAFLDHHPEHANNRVIVQGLTMPYRLGQVAQGEKLLRASQGEAGVPVFWPHDRETPTHETIEARGLTEGKMRPMHLNPVTSIHRPHTQDGSMTTSMAIMPVKGLHPGNEHNGHPFGAEVTDPIGSIIHHNAPHDPSGFVMAQGKVPPHAMLDVGHILHAHAGLNGVEGMMRIDRPDPPKGHDDEL